MQKHSWEALGTHFEITVWDQIEKTEFSSHAVRAEKITRDFDNLYSRFIPDSLISHLSTRVGEHEVPKDLVNMLRLYETLNVATEGKINPTIGFALSDSGYDATYSLIEKQNVREVPEFHDAIRIIDDSHIELLQPVLLDLGALGKGYVIDLMYEDMFASDLSRYLVDGSGDIRYFSNDQTPIECGLEHPEDPSSVIGTFSLVGGALCASATNRRRWGNRHHYIDPHSRNSPNKIQATWVHTDNTALADGLSSALFFTAPENLSVFDFSYLVVNEHLQMKHSTDFSAELFQ